MIRMEADFILKAVKAILNVSLNTESSEAQVLQEVQNVDFPLIDVPFITCVYGCSVQCALSMRKEESFTYFQETCQFPITLYFF